MGRITVRLLRVEVRIYRAVFRMKVWTYIRMFEFFHDGDFASNVLEISLVGIAALTCSIDRMCVVLTECVRRRKRVHEVCAVDH